MDIKQLNLFHINDVVEIGTRMDIIDQVGILRHRNLPGVFIQAEEYRYITARDLLLKGGLEQDPEKILRGVLLYHAESLASAAEVLVTDAWGVDMEDEELCCRCFLVHVNGMLFDVEYEKRADNASAALYMLSETMKAAARGLLNLSESHWCASCGTNTYEPEPDPDADMLFDETDMAYWASKAEDRTYYQDRD